MFAEKFDCAEVEKAIARILVWQSCRYKCNNIRNVVIEKRHDGRDVSNM